MGLKEQLLAQARARTTLARKEAVGTDVACALAALAEAEGALLEAESDIDEAVASDKALLAIERALDTVAVVHLLSLLGPLATKATAVEEKLRTATSVGRLNQWLNEAQHRIMLVMDALDRVEEGLAGPERQ